MLHQFLDGNMLGGAAVVPGTHEVFLVAVLSGIIVDLTAVPDFINHRLPVLFGYDHIGQVAHKVAEVLVAEPRQFVVLVHQEQPLKTPFHFVLKFLAEVLDDFIGQSPQGEVTGVVRPIAGNIVIRPVLMGDPEKLPCRPSVAVPDQFQKTVRLNHGCVFLGLQHLMDVAWQLQIFCSFLHQFFRQRIEQRQPGQVAGLRDFYDRLRQHDDKAVRADICHCNHLGFCVVWPLYNTGA